MYNLALVVTCVLCKLFTLTLGLIGSHELLKKALPSGLPEEHVTVSTQRPDLPVALQVSQHHWVLS